MERYEAYKDSGVEWIGEIPEGWRCIKLGLISSSTLGRMLDSERQSGECLAPYLSNKDVQWFRFISSDLKEMDFPHETRNSYKIIDGDMLVCEGGEVGRCAVWHGPSPDFFFQKALHRVRFNPSTMNPDFAAYQMFQKAQDTMFREVRKGESTISHLPGDQLSKLIMITPPLAEQRAIADFLDAKTAEIDGLVADCEREVELLQEYRKAVISEAVTKGLDPHAPMKDSGVEWIGEIPEGWSCLPLKHLTKSINSGTSLDGANWPAEKGEKGVLTLSSVYQGKFDPTQNKAVHESLHHRLSCPLSAGSLLISRCNTSEWVGTAAYVDRAPNNLYLPDKLWQLGFESNSICRYVQYSLQSIVARNHFALLSVGASSTMQNIAKPDLLATPIALPETNELSAIVAYLDAKTAEIDGLIDAKQQMAEKLREYRKSLISEAVTGKFKVPGVA